MVEDKLTSEQRVRLEALAQAQGLLSFIDHKGRSSGVRPDLDLVLATAEVIEQWLLQATGKVKGH